MIRKPKFARSAVLVASTTLISFPLIVVLLSVFLPWDGVWGHLREHLLADYVSTSLLLMLGVGCITVVIGVSTAYLIAFFDFPGRKIFEWALLLPLAFPSYLVAYTYTSMLDVAGPVQTRLRGVFDLSFGDYWFPSVRSLEGAIVIMSLVLYPYVYMITRAAFLTQSPNLIEASRNLGHSFFATFYRVVLPMARPAIVAGMSLALMEALADFGTVEYFGLNTFTTGIFRTWFGFGELKTAVQLSALLLSFVALLFFLEQVSRKKSEQLSQHTGSRIRAIELQKANKWFASLLCLIILLAGFLIPFCYLIFLTLSHGLGKLNTEYFQLIVNTFSLAFVSAILCLCFAFFIVFFKRRYAGKLASISYRFATLGYTLPGTVIAMGVLLPAIYFDKIMVAFLRKNFGIDIGLIISGTLLALCLAYVTRFSTVALQTLQSGLERVGKNIDNAAASLGSNSVSLFKHVHLPMLRGSILTASLLIFVEVLKELPAALILRPFNFNTLAVKTYELASDERLIDAALPALTIVLIGVIPIIVITRLSRRDLFSQKSGDL